MESGGFVQGSMFGVWEAIFKRGQILGPSVWPHHPHNNCFLGHAMEEYTRQGGGGGAVTTPPFWIELSLFLAGAGFPKKKRLFGGGELSNHDY